MFLVEDCYISEDAIISKEEQTLLIEQFLLNEENIFTNAINKFKEKISNLKKKLLKFFSKNEVDNNIKKADQIGKSLGSSSKSVINKNKSKKGKELESKEVAKDVNTQSKSFGRKISGFLKNILSIIKSKDFAENIFLSICLTFFACAINTMADVFLSLLFGPVLGTIASTIIVAPIVEEMMKNIAIKDKYDNEFLIVFNAAEFTMYVTRMVKDGMSLGAAAGIRLIPIIMHITTTKVQKLIINKKDKNTDPELQSKLALGTGILIHSVYNALVSFI